MYMDQVFFALDIDQMFDLENVAVLPSIYSVSHLASSSMAAVGCAIGELLLQLGLRSNLPLVELDQTLASHWFAQSVYPIDWHLPPVWDAIAGDYECSDGWIKLHTNLDHHRNAALSVLGCDNSRHAVATAVAQWSGSDLESKIVESGGVAAAMRTRKQWLAHPQGVALKSEPLVAWSEPRKGSVQSWSPTISEPLNGLKVLDLTRVLAGPVSTRMLAGFGADVLRIDPPGWDEPNVVPDITLGKRCAGLDLSKSDDRSAFIELLSNADVLVHGYRPNALEGLGFGKEVRQQLNSNLIEVSLNAYGWSGPWSGRRGFDSLVQMSCGIAHEGMKFFGKQKPTPLPVQALDHATGYLMAAAVIKALSRAVNDGQIFSAQLSLARTAELLISHPQENGCDLIDGNPVDDHFSQQIENTPWGKARRLKPALRVEDTPMKWPLAANKLGSSAPRWEN